MMHATAVSALIELVTNTGISVLNMIFPLSFPGFETHVKDSSEQYGIVCPYTKCLRECERIPKAIVCFGNQV